MIFRQLGTSSLTVSALGFGAGHIDTTGLSEKAAHDLLDTALDLGITFFDTARGYGASEERLGRWLPPHRDRVVLSTKVGYDIPGQQDWTAGAVTGGIDRALKTLNTETIDVVFLHSCSLPVLQQGELIEALLAARDAGKIRVPGYSGENTELAWAADAGVFGVLQTSVNLADQHSLRHTLPRAREHRLGVVAKRPLANAPWRHTNRPTGIYGESYWDRLQQMPPPPSAKAHCRPLSANDGNKPSPPATENGPEKSKTNTFRGEAGTGGGGGVLDPRRERKSPGSVGVVGCRCRSGRGPGAGLRGRSANLGDRHRE